MERWGKYVLDLCIDPVSSRERSVGPVSSPGLTHFAERKWAYKQDLFRNDKTMTRSRTAEQRVMYASKGLTSGNRRVDTPPNAPLSPLG